MFFNSERIYSNNNSYLCVGAYYSLVKFERNLLGHLEARGVIDYIVLWRSV